MPKKILDPNAPQQYPNQLLDGLLNHTRARNDATLARLMGVAPPVLSKLRHARLPVGAVFLLRAHDATGLSIAHLRALLHTRPAAE